ncbi:tyrosine-type recombinase/integrase [Actinospica robiniae]|uniref:tyrosine-type recombinase/integrase n=1 Tax=Actinospica robiniae TaxID=304901 RepID=UPI0009FCE987|nr:tyrosine-type recombinase/integrase [Actinospica robiniae]
MATGSIERLPSGKYRAVVYAGLDPLTRTRSYLKGPAHQRRTDAVADLDGLRAEALNGAGHTRAGFAAVLERYLQTAIVAAPTLVDYRRRVNRVIGPVLGHIPIGRIDVPLLEEFEVKLLRCSLACDGEGDGDRSEHVCRPLSASGVRRHMAVVSGALSMAVRYKWIGHNPARDLKPLRVERDERVAPTAEQVAQAVTRAFELELAFGIFLWLTAVTGAHRGEILKLRFRDVQLLTVPPRLALGPAYMVLEGKPTFTAGKRRRTRYVALDEFTAYLLTRYRILRIQAVGGHRFSEDEFLFPGLRGETRGRPRNPDAVTHAVARLGGEIGLHLTPTLIRHYNATELLASGLNVATVAARTGHADGGATLLRVYAHTTAASDVKAAEIAALAIKTPQIAALDPRRLDPVPADIQPYPRGTRLKHLAKLPPYKLVADDIHTAINAGTLQPGDPLPPIKDLAHWYGHSVATVHRAIALLAAEHLLDVRTGHRTRVAPGRGPTTGTAP